MLPSFLIINLDKLWVKEGESLRAVVSSMMATETPDFAFLPQAFSKGNHETILNVWRIWEEEKHASTK